MDIIRPTRIAYPTDSPFFGEVELTQGIARRLGEIQGRVGAALRIGRASGEHLEALQRAMSGQPYVQLHLTPGATLTAMLGDRRVNIPTFNDLVSTVNVAGVKYAPQQFLKWTGGAYQVIAPDQELASQIDDLTNSGFRSFGPRKQASLLQKRLNAWQASPVHVRAGPHEAGGALPYYLSKQVALHGGPGIKAGPIFEAGVRLENAIKLTTKAAMNPALHASGMEASYALQRNVAVSHLAMMMLAFNEGGIQSVGVKDARIKGGNAFHSSRYKENISSRLVFSTLPAHAYGILYPEQNLPKSIHHMKSRSAIRTGEVGLIRGGTGMRSTMPIVHGYEAAATEAAQAHWESMGVEGRVQLSTPARFGELRVKAGLSKEHARYAELYLSEMLGGSGVIAGRGSAADIVSMNTQFSKKTITNFRGGENYIESQLHPVIAERLKGQHGGFVRFDTPVTYEDLKEGFASGGRETPQGFIGSSMTSTGELKVRRKIDRVTGKPYAQEVNAVISPGQVIYGANVSPGKTHFMVENTGPRIMKSATQIIASEQGRLGVHEVAPQLFGGEFDFIGRFNASHPDLIMKNQVYEILQKHGLEGAEKVAKALGGTVTRNSAGEIQIVTGLEKFTAENLKNVEAVSAFYGMDPGPTVLDPAKAEQLRLYNPQGYAMLRGKGYTLEDTLELHSWYGEVSPRAGQPIRGKFGTVGHRMRDYRTDAVKWFTWTGMSPEALSDSYEARNKFISGAMPGLSKRQMDRVSNDTKRYLKSSKRISHQSSSAVADLVKLHQFTGLGDQSLVKGIKYKDVSLDEYRQLFDRAGPRRPGMSLWDMQRTPWGTIDDIGRASPTDVHYRIKMPRKGAAAQSRVPHAPAWEVEHVIMPSGQAMGWTPQEGLRSTIPGREGLKAGVAEMAWDLHEGLMGQEDVNKLYSLSGGVNVAALEATTTNAPGGLYRSGRELRSSMTADITRDITMGPGQMGMARSDVKQLLMKTGMPKSKVKKLLAGYMKTERTGVGDRFRALFEVDPALTPGYYQAREVRLIKDVHSVIDPSTGRRVRVDNRGNVRMNPGVLPAVARDYDVDPSRVALLGGSDDTIPTGSKEKLYADTEQSALGPMVEMQKRKDIADVAAYRQGILTTDVTNKVFNREDVLSTYKDLYIEAEQKALALVSTPMNLGPEKLYQASAATQAFSPSGLAAAANLRHRTRASLLRDVATGMLKPEDHSGDVRLAIETIQRNHKYASALTDLEAASVYVTLKKSTTHKMLLGQGAFAGMPDPQLMALTVKLGQISPSSPALEPVLSEAAGLMQTVMSEAEGNPFSSQMQFQGLSGTEGARELRTGVAQLTHSLAYLEGSGEKSIVQHFMRSPEGAGRTSIPTDDLAVARLLGSQAQPTRRGEAGPWGAFEAGVLPSSDEAARTSADAVADGAGQTMKGRALSAVAQGKALMKRLWDSKFGKPIMIGAGGLGALGIGKSLFGTSQPSYAPAGSPLPPNPMVQGVQADRQLGDDIPRESYGRVQRVSQVRTHMQVNGVGSQDFQTAMDMGSISFGRHGRMPVHGGEFINEGGSLNEREEARQAVRSRFRSEF